MIDEKVIIGLGVSGLFAVGTGIADSSWPATVAGCIALIGAAGAAVYGRFNTESVKAEAERLAMAVRNCEERAARLETKAWDLQAKLTESEKERERLSARVEDLKSSNRKSETE